MKTPICLLLTLLFIGGCSGAQQESPSMPANALSLRLNDSLPVSLQFLPIVLPQMNAPYNSAEDDIFDTDEAYAFDAMENLEDTIENYMRTKFLRYSEEAPVIVEIRIEEYSISGYNSDSMGKQITDNLVGIQSRWTKKPHMRAIVSILDDLNGDTKEIVEVALEDQQTDRPPIWEARMLHDQFILHLNKFFETKGF